MRLAIPKHSTKLFGWMPNDKIFLSSTATLGRPVAGQVYDDALDVGFDFVSELTGQVVLVFLAKELKNANGKIISWEFRPGVDSPDRDKFMIKVFND